jgi:bifunctional UDP-N-acetylglucosamine pyrophosphorylase/glucosamine-1-phosphate N-acetyltransferase
VPLLRAGDAGATDRDAPGALGGGDGLTAVVENPDGYGRIVRDEGRIAAIVEHKDASPAERAIRGDQQRRLRVRSRAAFAALRSIGSANAQVSTTCPNLVRIYRADGLTVETVTLEDPDEIRGVNSRKELAEVSTILRARKNDELMVAGVTLVDPSNGLHRSGPSSSAPTRSSIPAYFSKARRGLDRGVRFTRASAS